jgi:thiamine kinase-like enzyme
MNPDNLIEEIRKSLDANNILDELTEIKVLKGGKNNQTYKVDLRTGASYVVKKYFKHPHDLRNRQNAEFLFTTYANKVASNFVPQVLFSDAMNRMTLFEYLQGSPVIDKEVTDSEVKYAIDFVNALNDKTLKKIEAQLPNASEACFTIKAHLDLIDSRIDVLHDVLNKGKDQDASEFIGQLAHHWNELKRSLFQHCTNSAISIDLALPPEDRCISPSDFGFHNALKDSFGAMRFIDFEYAGWDDPAKLVGDFFAQLEVPVPEKFAEVFIESISHNFSGAHEFKIRSKLLLPVYKIKWCCIALNVYLPAHLSRRQFSNPLLDVSGLQSDQLSKAKTILSNLQKKSYELH